MKTEIPKVMVKKSITKIAILLPTMQVGGAEMLLIEELSYLRNDQRFYFEVHLVFEEGVLYAKLKDLGIYVKTWHAHHDSPLMLFTYINIARYLYKKDFDIIHIHLLNFLGPFVGMFAGLTTMLTVHNDVNYGLLERFCLRRSDLLFGCCSQVVENLKKFVPARKIRLLQNATKPVRIDLAKKEKYLRRLDLPKERSIVLSLGRLSPQKGYDILIESFKLVVNREPNAILLIGGSGPCREDILRQIGRLGMQNHIYLLGMVEQVHELIHECELYVNSSRWEGLPMTLIEVLSQGKPIVATRVGGNSEVVINGETGFLVPPEDPHSLAEAILKVLEEKDLKNRIKAHALTLFEKNYSIRKHCEILADEYILSKNKIIKETKRRFLVD